MRITLPSGTAAELTHPATGEVTRGMVMAPDIGGLRPLFDELSQRLSDEHGWVICAPEPWPGRESMPLEDRLAAVGSLRDDDVLGDMLSAADATDCDTVGVFGFCMGGMYTLKAAGTGRFVAAAAFYGMIRVPEQWKGEQQGEPLDAVTAPGACPVLAIVGTNDVWTPMADIDALEATSAVVRRYEGADHGFVHDPSRPSHRPDDAADAWQHVIAHLKA